MTKIIWGITGSGDKIDEVYDAMLNLHQKTDIRIKVIVSKAGEQVLRWYKLWDRLNESFDKVLVETDANVPFIAGPLQIGKYDLLVVAPLTANSTAKIAHGIADTLITNAVAQTLKGLTPVLLMPVDQHPGEVKTVGPNNEVFVIEARRIDLENVARLREMKGVTLLGSPADIASAVKQSL
ncbi:MAG: archaeoflavoprotein AfpA [Candidatus Thorarchaeota archaeon]|nr:archaeoflavoprotein AfpA [Candidatus Thorarchaeota archaeon]